MHSSPRARAAVLSLITAAAVSACSDAATTAPPAGGPAERSFAQAVVASGPGNSAPVLRRTTPLANDIVVYATIQPGKKGANAVSVKIKEAGLQVSFPWNAVKVPTTIKLTAYAGDLVSYSFEPHGIVFDTLLKVQQDLSGTSAYKDDALRQSLLGAYLDDDQKDIDADGIATMTETFPIYYNESDPTGTSKLTPSVAKFSTNHFSGYIIATGKRSQ